MDSEPMRHAPEYVGGPCSRCGLRYSVKTAYIPCFEPGDTYEVWRTRYGVSDEVLALIDASPPTVK